MVAGHLQTKKGYYYIVLNMRTDTGARKTKGSLRYSGRRKKEF